MNRPLVTSDATANSTPLVSPSVEPPRHAPAPESLQEAGPMHRSEALGSLITALLREEERKRDLERQKELERQRELARYD